MGESVQASFTVLSADHGQLSPEASEAKSATFGDNDIVTAAESSALGGMATGRNREELKLLKPGTPQAISLTDPILQRVMLHMPGDVRSTSTAFLAIMAGIVMLRWTEEYVVPVLLGVFLSYALTPLIDRLEAWHLPRVLGAGLVIAALLAALGGTAYALRGEADEFLTSLPKLVTTVRQAIVGSATNKASAIARVQAAASNIESAAVPSSNEGKDAGAGTNDRSDSKEFRVLPPVPIATSSVRGFLMTGTLGAAAFVGQFLVVIFVALSLLASGDRFRMKMVKLAGPKLSKRRVTVQALDEVHSQIQRYLLVQLVTSLIVGVTTGVTFFFVGLNNAAVWGAVAAFTNLIPYIGAIATSGLAGVAGVAQFGSVEPGVWLALASFGIHLVVGNIVTPWMSGRSSRMSPFVVFVGVLFFGWLWGVAGLVLAFPILVAIKIVCEHIEELNPLGELLSG